MNFSKSNIYKHLMKLVEFDTQNPPRHITIDSPIFLYLKEKLVGFTFEVIDDGDGCLSLLAIRGNPQLLFNFHIDTVPIAEGWTSNPFTLKLHNESLIGLGACDIKGAAACMLSAVSQTDGDVALLFSSDEEHGSSRAIKKFLSTKNLFKRVIVAEPTMAKAVVAHRGIQTATAIFSGKAGHASEPRALLDNAIHKAGKWIANATKWVDEQTQAVENLSGLPFNIGTIDGGVKANMIASKCEMKFGFRPLPGQDSVQVLDELAQLSTIGKVELQAGFFGPCLPAANQNFSVSLTQAKEFAMQLGIEVGEAVNFWTEASLFSQAGCTSFVFGPGNIAQAHTADEWVEISQLKKVEMKYINILENLT
jgi:acetylornithine deacetylase